MSETSTHRQVPIKAEYYAEIEKIVKHSAEFGSVSDYVNRLLQEVLFGGGDAPYTQEEEEAVKQRLRDLGYL